jgi:ribulose 1,5-bisphosphate synthetase/thiazole synthase
MWCWRRIQKVNRTGRVKSEKRIKYSQGEKDVLNQTKEDSLTGLVTSGVETAF